MSEENRKPVKIKQSQIQTIWPRIEIGKSQRRGIQKAFRLFDRAGHGLVSADIVKIAIRALGQDISNLELDNLKKTFCVWNNTNQEYKIDLQQFEKVMEHRMLIADTHLEKEKAFEMMLELDSTNKTRTIGKNQLRLVANYLKENITDEQIGEMIESVTGDQSIPVTYQDYLRVLSVTKKPSKLKLEQKK